MSSTDSLKKPTNTFFLWRNARRKSIQEMVGSKAFKVVAAKTSELWKLAGSVEKSPFEKEYQHQKDAYDAYVLTDVGQKALEAKEAGKKDEKKKKQELISGKHKTQHKCIAPGCLLSECKADVKVLEEDEKLKRPATAYWMWLQKNRKILSARVNSIGTRNPINVSAARKGHIGEMWRQASSEEKAPFEEESQRQKATYKAYVATEEGHKAWSAKKARKKDEKQAKQGLIMPNAFDIAKEIRECNSADVEETARKKQRCEKACA
jgi:hypothetical protein